MTRPDLDGPWWDWAARLRALMAAREAAAVRSAALRAELDAARAEGLKLRHQRRLQELARRRREAS